MAENIGGLEYKVEVDWKEAENALAELANKVKKTEKEFKTLAIAEGQAAKSNGVFEKSANGATKEVAKMGIATEGTGQKVGELGATSSATVGKINNLENAEKSVGNEAEQMGNKVDATKGKINGMGVAAAGFATGAGVAMFNTVRDGTDKVAKLSDAVGVDTNELYGLIKAADLYGVAGNQVVMLMVKTTVRANQAAKGNETYAAAFKSLGVSVKDTNGNMRSTTDILYDVIAGMANAENSQEALTTAYGLFGRQAMAVNQIAAGGADAFKEQATVFAENTTVTNENANAIESMNDAISLAKSVFAEAMVSIVASLAPAVESIANFISENEWLAKLLVVIAGAIVAIGVIYLGYSVIMAGVTVVMAAYNAIMGIVTVAQNAWRIATLAMAVANLILDASMLPVIAIIAVVIAIIIAVIMVIRNWGDIVVWLQQKWEEFKNKIAEIFNFLWTNIYKPTLEMINKYFVQPMLDAIERVKKAFKELVNFFQSIWDGIINIFKKGVNTIIGLLNKIPFVNIPTMSVEGQKAPIGSAGRSVAFASTSRNISRARARSGKEVAGNNIHTEDNSQKIEVINTFKDELTAREVELLMMKNLRKVRKLK